MGLKSKDQDSQFVLQEFPKKERVGGSVKNQRYSVVPYELRVKLIELASKRGYSASRAARELGIKISTGKFIVKTFRDTGRIMRKTKNQLYIKTLKSQWEKSSGYDTKEDQRQELSEKMQESIIFEKNLPQEIQGLTISKNQNEESNNPMMMVGIPPQFSVHPPCFYYFYYPNFPSIQLYDGMMNLSYSS